MSFSVRFLAERLAVHLHHIGTHQAGIVGRGVEDETLLQHAAQGLRKGLFGVFHTGYRFLS